MPAPKKQPAAVLVVVAEGGTILGVFKDTPKGKRLAQARIDDFAKPSSWGKGGLAFLRAHEVEG